ncbi:8-amino-7-oxononanoate synthase [Vibrio sp. LaRot3]|uniref:8-amino-7-oxononanoate synthase n=1 Tax=Vibrio sp. LaRot3 TaxID=2998829 RepID=UPI0022CE34F1|nr:8-amino-7-oxononanoate synthase [Vibrio sp. LaRot3]MDA0147275.1 8-amino-7-oxononanoate synthase [Vibrio sp. LaRot3]
MPAFNQRFERALAKRESSGLTRQLSAIKDGNQAHMSSNLKYWVNFSNNDYLGLAADAMLSREWQRGIDLYGNGSAASPLVTGFSPAHHELEAKLCSWLGYSRAVLFSSGFAANQALLFSLLESGDALLQDKLNHASLMEAGMLSPANMRRFRHNDSQHASQLIDATTNTFVVTEGVFSMDGDQAPLRELERLRSQHCWLVVDDAHGIGVLGDEGKGSCDVAGVTPDILVVTFGKAFGLSGAAILCNHTIGDYLTQFARHHVYSTAIPPAQAHALSAAIDLISTQQWRRDKLVELSHCYDSQFGHCNEFVATNTPIKPLMVCDEKKTLEIAAKARELGFWLTAIRPPTVPKGKARLRITLTANHRLAEIRALANAITPLLTRN